MGMPDLMEESWDMVELPNSNGVVGRNDTKLEFYSMRGGEVTELLGGKARLLVKA